jgi:hypothetical protein
LKVGRYSELVVVVLVVVVVPLVSSPPLPAETAAEAAPSGSRMKVSPGGSNWEAMIILPLVCSLSLCDNAAAFFFAHDPRFAWVICYFLLDCLDAKHDRHDEMS